MKKSPSNIFKTLAAKADWDNGLVTRDNYSQNNSANFSFQRYISHNLFEDKKLNLDAIYFTGATPVVLIKQLSKFDPTKILALQKRFWNEGRIPISLIITPDMIKVIDNYATPEGKEIDIDNITLQSYSTSENDLNILSEVLKQSKLDGEKVIGSQLKVKINEKVDHKLISQLRHSRKILHEDYGLPFNIIHDLLGRCLFTLYLEHRKILTPKDYPTNKTNAKCFFDLLDKSFEDTYRLFDYLKEKFNGDLFPVSGEEREVVSKNISILDIIYKCYSCSLDLSDDQLTLGFHLFDFNYIPIELISAIYEEFMSEEDSTKNIIKITGAFYTPQMLVEFIYNEVLPMPSIDDCNYNIKILDPACGSGIFLVEGFKRIIERWKFSNDKSEVDEKTLQRLLSDNIFGIESHPEAIKVTAFSLYLTFLHNMNPKKVLNKVRFLPLIEWTSPKEIRAREASSFGRNLLQASTFIQYDNEFNKSREEVKSFFNNNFDLVVGNPPWRRGKLDNEIKIFSKQSKWNIGGDIINAFLAYIPSIAPNAKIALIFSTKVLFNTNHKDELFRFRLFTENKISVIINFSVIRDILFDKAKQSAGLLIYKKRDGLEIANNESIIYCIPKTKQSIQNRRTIVIDASEIKHIPLFEVLAADSKIFKIAMFGNSRDLKFISKLRHIPSINQLVNSKHKGGGLHIREANKAFGNVSLAEHIFIPDDRISHYTISSEGLKILGTDHIKYRTNNKNVFGLPVILLNEGTKNSKFCASLVEFNCTFRKSVYAFKFPNKNLNYHKALVVCLNSTLANYFYFLISSNWGVSKGGQIQNNEALMFPVITELFSTDIINKLAEYFDKIKDTMQSYKVELEYFERVQTYQSKIDEIIYSELKITNEEKALIDNVLNYSSVLQGNYRRSRAELPVFPNQLEDYAKYYYMVLKKYLKGTAYHASIEIYIPSDIVCIKIIFDNHDKGVSFSRLDISKKLKEINKFVYSENSESIYYRKVIKYETRNSYYLIKPNQTRFWTKASALNDADALIVDLLSR